MHDDIKNRSINRERRRLLGRTSMLNERAGQFYKVVHCSVTRQLKTEARNMLENIDDLALKQTIWRIILLFFGVRCFNTLSVQRSFIQRCLSITLWRNNVFHSRSRNYFPALESFLLA